MRKRRDSRSASSRDGPTMADNIAGGQSPQTIHLEHAVFGGRVSLDEPDVVERMRLDVGTPRLSRSTSHRLGDEGLDGARGLGQCAIEEPIKGNGRRNQQYRNQNIHSEQDAAH